MSGNIRSAVTEEVELKWPGCSYFDTPESKIYRSKKK